MTKAASWHAPLSLESIVRESGGSIQTGPFGSQLHAHEYTSGGTPVIMPVNLRASRISDVGIARVGELQVTRLRRHVMKSHDLVVSRRGDVGRTALVTAAQDGWLCGTGCLAIKLGQNGASISPRFLAYALSSEPAVRWLKDNAVGGTMPNLNTRILGSLRIPLPPLVEQQRIAEALSDADELIVGLERMIAKRQAIKQGMMQQLLTGQTRLPGFTEPWREVNLGEVTTWSSGGTPSRARRDFWRGDIPWISATTLKALEVSSSDQCVTPEAVRSGSKMAPVDATLLLVRGSSLHKEIRASLVTAPVCFNQDVKALVPLRELVPKFLTYVLHGRAANLLMLVTSAGNTAGVLNTGDVQALVLRVPGAVEQLRIVSVLDELGAEIDLLIRRLAKARAVKQGMMQELLTGRTRLGVAEGAE